MTWSAVWIDPVELTATAGGLAEQTLRIQETVTGTRTTCTCEVPRSLIAWLDEELNAITVEALTVAVAYAQEAVDCRQRALEVEAEQSLVAAVPALAGVATGPVLAATTMGGFSSYGEPAAAVATTGWGGPGHLLGAVTPAPAVPSTGWGNPGFLLNPYSGPGWQPLPLGFGALGGSGGSLGDTPGYLAIKNLTAERGITHLGSGIVEDSRGRRGTPADIYVNRDGRGEVI